MGCNGKFILLSYAKHGGLLQARLNISVIIMFQYLFPHSCGKVWSNTPKALLAGHFLMQHREIK